MHGDVREVLMRFPDNYFQHFSKECDMKKILRKIAFYVVTFLAGALTTYIIVTKKKREEIHKREVQKMKAADLIGTRDEIDKRAVEREHEAYKEVFNETKQEIVNRFFSNFSDRPDVDG